MKSFKQFITEAKFDIAYRYKSKVSKGLEVFTLREINGWKRQGLHVKVDFILNPANAIKGYINKKGDFIKGKQK